jgi:ankyrin repeat protein
MSAASDLHSAVRSGDVTKLRQLLEADRALANARSETDARGTFPLHVAAEFGQAEAARVLLEHGADQSLLDAENDAIALSWAAFFGRPGVARVLLAAGAEVNQRNKHGLTAFGCAAGGAEGRWKQFSDATIEEWKLCASVIASHGGHE